MEKLISLKEAGLLLGGICEKSVRRSIADGHLPGIVKVRGRALLPLSEVLAYIEEFKNRRKQR